MVSVERTDTKKLDDHHDLTRDRYAAVIAPQGDVDRIERVLSKRTLERALVREEHLSVDRVTGGRWFDERGGTRDVAAGRRRPGQRRADRTRHRGGAGGRTGSTR